MFCYIKGMTVQRTLILAHLVCETCIHEASSVENGVPFCLVALEKDSLPPFPHM